MPKITVIIVNWNVTKLLQACLTSLRRQTDCSLQIIVVDNASADDSVKMIRDEFPEIDLITNQTNRGFATANNQGLRQAKSDYILFLNPDTIVPAGSVNTMAKALETDSQTAIIAPKILNSDDSVQPSIRRDPTAFNQALVLLKLINIFPWLPGLRSYLQRSFDYDQQQIVEQVKGAAFMMRRETLEKIGGWDEDFFLWFEEVDLCLRTRQSGKHIVYYPKAQITHYGGASFEQTYTRRKQKLFNDSLLHYADKHFSSSQKVLLYLVWPINVSLTFVWSLFKK